MADPLTALMYAVQVMHLLKNLTEKTLRERKNASSQIVPCDDSEVKVSDVVEEYNQEEEDDKGVDDVNKEEEIIKMEDEVKPSNGLDFDKEKKQKT